MHKHEIYRLPLHAGHPPLPNASFRSRPPPNQSQKHRGPPGQSKANGKELKAVP
jgi:hypothetical protein